MMARSWRDVRAEAVADGRLSEERVAEMAAHLRDQVRAEKLTEIRRSQHVTQTVLAHCVWSYSGHTGFP